MTYNLSEATVSRWEYILEKLDGEEVLKLKTNYPHKLAYRLREAVKAAQHHKIEPFCRLDYSFGVRDGFVLATPSTELVASVESDESAADEPTPEIQTNMFEGAISEFDIVGIMGKAAPARAVFPDFEGDLEAVEAWAEAKDYEVEQADPLTVRRKDG